MKRILLWFGLVALLSVGFGSASNAATIISSPGDGTCVKAGSSINITWTSDDATYAHGSLSYDAAFGSGLIAHPATSPYSWTVPSVTDDIGIQVDSHNSGHSVLSTATNVFSADSSGPTASTVSSTGQTTGSINLSWTASSDAGCQGLGGYRVYRDGNLIYTGSATSFQDTGLSAGTGYTYRVDSYDAFVTTAGSNKSISTSSPPAPPPSNNTPPSSGTPPAAPGPTAEAPAPASADNPTATPASDDPKTESEVTDISHVPITGSADVAASSAIDWRTVVGIGLLVGGLGLGAAGWLFWVRKPAPM